MAEWLLSKLMAMVVMDMTGIGNPADITHRSVILLKVRIEHSDERILEINVNGVSPTQCGSFVKASVTES